MKKLRTGEVVFNATTNAQLLNEVVGTNYKAWMRAAWEYSDNTDIWMVYIDGRSRGEGFVDSWLDRNTVVQKYKGKTGKFGGVKLEFVHIKDYRYIFEKIDGIKERRYIFQGLFKFDRTHSTPENLIFRRISDTFPN